MLNEALIVKDTSDALIHRVLSINSHCDFFFATWALKNHVLIEVEKCQQ